MDRERTEERKGQGGPERGEGRKEGRENGNRRGRRGRKSRECGEVGKGGEGAEGGAGDQQEVLPGRKLTYFSWADVSAAKATVETARCSVRLGGSQAGCPPRPPPPYAQRAVSFINSSFPRKAGIPSQTPGPGFLERSGGFVYKPESPPWDFRPESRFPFPWGRTRPLCSGTLT